MNYEENGGKLVQISGKVTDVVYSADGTGVSQFWIEDGSGEKGNVFIDGYITSGTTGKNNNDGNTGNSGNAGSGSQNGNGKKPQNTANKGAQTGDQQPVTMYLVLIAASVIAVSFTKKRKVN